MSDDKRSVRSVPSDRSRLRPSGGYRDLRSFQVATVIYDATVDFCARFLDQRSRTVDQMVQAARSGRQNIAEGSRASATSSQTELRLVNVARASLDELLLDYEDFLRQRKLRAWTKDAPDAKAVRAVGRQDRPSPSDQPDPRYTAWLSHADPAVVANTLICLIHQANYLLDQQIRALETQFVEGGGYTEQLAAARLAHRRRADQSDQSDQSDRSDRSDQSDQSDRPAAPTCRQCGKPMVLRTARQGARAGSQFWGCSGYPACKSTQPI
jgi:restriction system protein